MQFLPILALGVLMYLLLVRPQQRRVREQRELVRNVGVGARIQTIGGMIGEVVGAEEDLIHVEVSPGVVITFVRAAVGRIIEQPAEEPIPDDLSELGADTGATAADEAPAPAPPEEAPLAPAPSDDAPPAPPAPPSVPEGTPAEPTTEEGPEAGPIGGVAS